MSSFRNNLATLHQSPSIIEHTKKTRLEPCLFGNHQLDDYGVTFVYVVHAVPLVPPLTVTVRLVVKLK